MESMYRSGTNSVSASHPRKMEPTLCPSRVKWGNKPGSTSSRCCRNTNWTGRGSTMLKRRRAPSRICWPVTPRSPVYTTKLMSMYLCRSGLRLGKLSHEQKVFWWLTQFIFQVDYLKKTHQNSLSSFTCSVEPWWHTRAPSLPLRQHYSRGGRRPL